MYDLKFFTMFNVKVLPYLNTNSSKSQNWSFLKIIIMHLLYAFTYELLQHQAATTY